MTEFAPDNPHGLLLYDFGGSPCARRVRISLLEKGLDWDTEVIDLTRLEQRNPDYLKINPNGFVPTLAHGERVIFESNVITEYLDDAFPDRPLYPDEPWELFQVKSWQAAEAAMAKDYRTLMYQRLMGLVVRLTRTLDEALAAARRSAEDAADLAWEERVWRLEVLTPAEEAAYEARLLGWLEALERALDDREFLVGGRFTQAEISIYPRVMMFPFVRIPIARERFPNVAAWCARLAVAASLFRRVTGGSDAADEAPRERAPIRTPRNGRIPPARAMRRTAERPVLASADEPLVLYDDPRSPHARRIRLLLREKGLAYETVPVNLLRMEQKAPDFLALCPQGELPVLRHGSRVLTDSQLIAEYLEQTFVDPGRPPLLPVDAWEAAQVRMWLALEAGSHKELRPLFWLHGIWPALLEAGVRPETVDAWVAPGVSAEHRAFLRSVVAGSHRFDSSPELAREIVRRKLALLEEPLAGRACFVGETITLADVAWYTRVDSLPALGIELEPDRHPHLLRWFAGVRDRLARSEP